MAMYRGSDGKLVSQYCHPKQKEKKNEKRDSFVLKCPKLNKMHAIEII